MSNELNLFRWTTEPPCQPGWYFVRGDDVGTFVSWERGYSGDWQESPPPAGIEYAGPIPAPLEPEPMEATRALLKGLAERLEYHDGSATMETWVVVDELRAALREFEIEGG